MADIRKRNGKRGVTWQARYRDKKTGKIRYKSFPRRMDAEAFLVSTHSSDYLHDSDSTSMADAADRWLEVCTTTGRKGREPVEASTARKYAEHAEIIKEMMGGVMLSQLTPPICNQFRDDLLGHYSRRYAKKILTSFKSILSQARTDEFLKSDPAENTAIILSQRYEKKDEMAIPSVEEVGLLLRKAAELANGSNAQIRKAWSRYAPFFYVLAYSGMRPCEAIGLPWKDVDFDSSTVDVTQDATETGEIGLPKSASAYRTIHMPQVAMTALKKWKQECPDGVLGLVFPNWKGGVESHANITNRGWYVLQKECGLLDHNRKPKYPLKSLRHVRASLEIHNGATAKEIQMLMGHSSVKITFDVYGHLFKDHEEERAARADLIADQLSACGEYVAS
ncbi:tyrosine-type recombinase/integrase [Terasakiella sp.]|uniref:tyrosine-type recombinase/integrase n=1 Tax=Terasakiella sp. TaxID=2034861 RepID=UPI003AA93636